MPYGSTTYGTATYGEGSLAVTPTVPPTMIVGYPTLLVEVAFTTRPLATPTWVDITRYVRAGSTRRGRSSALDTVSAGTLELVLGNQDRRFDPLNPGGPHYGYLLPNRRVRVRATFEGVTYPIFDGFVARWQQEYAFGDHEASCRLSAVDGLAFLANAGVTDSSRGVERSGLRVAAVLNDARVGWPAGLRFIDLGSSYDQADSWENTTALDVLHEIDVTEQGRMFVAADGTFTFLDRNRLITDSTYINDQVVFGDDIAAGEVPYSDVAFDHSVDLIRNLVTVTNPLWGAFTAEDSTSQLDYGTRAHSITAIDAAPQASQSTANNLLRLYKSPQSRVESVKVVARRTTPSWPTGLFPAVLGLDLGWRVGMRRRGSTYTISQSYQVESIAHRFAAADRSWVSEFGFGVPQVAESYWLWGTGLWGSTTKWAW